MKNFTFIFLMCMLSLQMKADDNGSCGDGVKYSFKESNGTLTISGNGVIRNHNRGQTPWYSYKDKILKIIIGEGITEIGANAFRESSKLTDVIIPNSLTKIEYYAFQDCESITSINLNNCVKYLGSATFYNCKSLASVTGFSSLEVIVDNAFRDTPWFDNLPDGPIYLGRVFYNYKGTMPENTSYTFKDGTTCISESSFLNCSGLVAVTIPKSVSVIYGRAFSGCHNLSSISVESGNNTYDSRDNCNAVISKSSNKLVAGCKNTKIPGSVTEIATGAFFNQDNITSVVIPNNISKLDNQCFAYCDGLTSIVIGNGLKNVYESSFMFCHKLKSITIVDDNPYLDSRDNCNAIINSETNAVIIGCPTTVIPKSVKSIEEDAFYGYNTLYNVIIPNNVEVIKNEAFKNLENLNSIVVGSGVKDLGKFSGCGNIKEIFSMIDFPYVIADNTFEDDVFANALLRVPVGSKINYMTTQGWYKFQNITEFDPATFDPAILDVNTLKKDKDKNHFIYDLKGMRVDHPQKGIYIKNGRKFHLK